MDIVKAYAREVDEWHQLKREHRCIFATPLAIMANGTSNHMQRWRNYSVVREMQGDPAQGFITHYHGTNSWRR